MIQAGIIVKRPEIPSLSQLHFGVILKPMLGRPPITYIIANPEAIHPAIKADVEIDGRAVAIFEYEPADQFASVVADEEVVKKTT